jgi:hypothetical protein
MHAANGLRPAEVTSKDLFAAMLYSLMEIEYPTEPRMPLIKHL